MLDQDDMSDENDMMDEDRLRELAKGFRAEPKSHADDALVKAIESDLKKYRAIAAKNLEQLPVAPLDRLLPLMGWLVYEASWEAVQRVVTGFDRFDAADRRRVDSETALDCINRLADVARGLPWPEFAPRALGAIRSQALAESKRDTEAGYDAAWLLHEEGRTRYSEFRDSHGDDPRRADYVLALDEVMLQLALAETGTACRTAEQVIGRWEDFAHTEDADNSRVDEGRWIQRMFRQLTDGVEVGELALETAARIRDEYGFVHKPSESRLALFTALQNPGIMTARAALLQLAMWRGMVWLGREQPAGFETWEAWEAEQLERFNRAYRAIEEQVLDENDKPVVMRREFQRQLVHVRIDIGLLKPGYDLPSQLTFAPCLRLNPLDADAVQALSAWLAENTDGKGRWRGFGAATMPGFVRSVVACRGLGPDDHGYQDWRRTWFEHDQYADDPGRRERVEAALALADG